MKKANAEDTGVPVGQYVLFPENFTRAACEMCGECCNSDWVVEMDKEEFIRYKRILAESDLPEEYGSFLRELTKDGHVTYRLLPRDGKCVFLLPGNECYIHGKHGLEAKSRTCRNYPLALSAYSPRGVHLTMSFICPSILRSLLLTDKIKTTKMELKNDLRCLSTVRFCNEDRISWDTLFLSIDALSGLFLNKSYHVEDNLIIAGMWASDLYNALKKEKTEELHLMLSPEYLLQNKQSLFNRGNEFTPQFTEQMNLISHIAHAILPEESVNDRKKYSSLNIACLMESKESIMNIKNKLQGTYNRVYSIKLPDISHVAEKYLLHKILGMKSFTRNGLIYGINHLTLCYSFFRLYLLAEIMCGKDVLDTDDVLKAVSFVELTFFHRKSMEYLNSSEMVNLLSKPLLSILLVRL